MIATNAEPNNTSAAAAPQSPTVTPNKTRGKKAATPKKNAPKTPKSASAPTRAVKTGRKASHPPVATRTESKGGKILEMIGRAKGATLAELMTATGWQAHSVRGFISTAPKKHDVKIESSKNDAGERVYRSIR